ncbi:MAG: phage tail tape measure protein [Acidobacteria bacterium]|nr:phage tail tape measure protein [Acidobacteriota bacterium]
MFDVGAIVARMDLALDGWNKSVEKVKGDQSTLGGGITGVGKQFTSAGTVMVAAGAAVAGGLFAMTKATANAGDEVAKLSDRTGTSTETLSSYSRVLKLGDSSLADFAKGMKSLSTTMADAAAGDALATEKLDALGISAVDVNGNLRPLNDVFLEAADKISKFEAGAKKSAIAADIFGKAGIGLIPTLNLGREGLEKEADAAHRMGLVFTNDAAKASELFNDTLADLGLSISGAKNQLSLALMPAITAITAKITEVVQKFTAWTQANPGLAAAITKVVAGAGALLVILGTGSLVIGKIIGLFGSLSTAIAGATAAKIASGAAWTVLIALVAKYAVTLQQLSDAEDYEIEAEKRLHDVQERSIDNLSKAAVAAGFHYGQMSRLIDAYDGNLAALTHAIRAGKEGVEIQTALANVGKENEAVIIKNKEALEGATLATKNAAEAQQAWLDFLKNEGLQTIAQKSESILTLRGRLKDLDIAYKTQDIDLDTYLTGVKKVNEELGKYWVTTNAALGKTRDFSGVLEKALPILEDNYQDWSLFDDELTETTDQMGKGSMSSMLLTHEMARLDAATKGIMLPDLVFPSAKKEAVRKDVDDFKHYWDGFFNDVSSKWGDTINDFASGNTSIVTAWNRLFKNLGETITDFVGKFITEKLIGAIQGIVGPAKTAAEGAGSAIGGIGTVVANVAKTVGSAIADIAGGILDVIEDIATTVVDIVSYAIKELAEAIAAAAHSLAAAAPDLVIVGLAAAAIFLAFGLAAALIDAARKVLGVGGGGGDDAANWLRLIHPLVQEMHDMFRDLIAIQVYRQGQGDTQIDRLDTIGSLLQGVLNSVIDFGSQTIEAINKVRDAIASVPAAAGGGVFMRPTFALIGERPEAAIPLERLNEFRGKGEAPAAQPTTSPAKIEVNIASILIDKGDKWMIKFVQETMNHGGLTVPLSIVGG